LVMALEGMASAVKAGDGREAFQKSGKNWVDIGWWAGRNGSGKGGEGAIGEVASRDDRTTDGGRCPGIGLTNETRNGEGCVKRKKS
jgi:hypothetical protein